MNSMPPMESFSDAELATESVIRPVRFKPLTFQDAVTSRPDYRWVIYGLVPAKALVVLVSPPKVGKSFLSVDWSLYVAMGKSWGDVEVEQGAIVYLAGEGEQGFSKRLQAWSQENGDPGNIPFVALTERVNLLDTEGQVKVLIEEIERHLKWMCCPLSMIVIDTVARSMTGGEENSGKDMGVFIDNVDRLRKHFDCTAMCVHHMGKDRSKGMRGHTSLHGAADAVIELSRDESRLITAHVSDQKDGESGAKFPFRLRKVIVGQDTRGRDVSSCIVVRADEEVAATKNRGPQLRGDLKNAYSALTQTLLSYGKMPGTAEVPNGIQAVDGSKWREECYRGWLSLVEDEKVRSKKFENAARELKAKDMIGISKPWVWRVAK